MEKEKTAHADSSLLPGLVITFGTGSERPMKDCVNDREKQSPEDGDPESMHFKAFDESPEHPKEETVHNKGKNPERKDIEREREEKENRLDRNPDNSPEERENECCSKALDRNTGNHIRQRKKRESAHQPSKENHSRSINSAYALSIPPSPLPKQKPPRRAVLMRGSYFTFLRRLRSAPAVLRQMMISSQSDQFSI